jgi:glyoxylase-like metal-dependent hydrolase (beta-lactamase superfamily II)
MNNNKNVIIIPVGELEVNCVIMMCPATGYAFIFDPGDEADKIIDRITISGAVPAMIINTHCHYDHIGAVEKLRKKFNIPFLVHELEKEYSTDPSKNYSAMSGKNISIEPDGTFTEGDILKAGSIDIEVIHTPGHTLGSCCFRAGHILISGDTLFAGSVGRADLYGGNEKTLTESIKEKLMRLDDDTVVIPGHGRQTTIMDEKRFNPFL